MMWLLQQITEEKFIVQPLFSRLQRFKSGTNPRREVE
jgi:hypothetical protein